MSDATVQPPPGRTRRALRLLLRLAKWCALAVAFGALTVAALFLYYARDLPRFDALTDYRPRQGTKVYAKSGTLVAEFFHERRTVVPKDQIPQLLKQAVIAAEDASFYRHQGIDYPGIARAALHNALHLSVREGASTITQQVVRTFLLTPERRLSRKIKEAILATRLEQNLSKDDILYLYLNQIYFGHLRYGVAEAAEFYFGKPVQKLSLGEVALLAGLPQSPPKLSPLRYPDRARARQAYVLGQMTKNGFITQAQADAELRRPIALGPEPPEPVGAYYVEEVRRQLEERHCPELRKEHLRLVEQVGHDRATQSATRRELEERWCKVLYQGGLRVTVAMDPAAQRAAEQVLRFGLEELERRQGYRGRPDGPPKGVSAPPGHAFVPPEEFKKARPKLAARLALPMPSRDPIRRPKTTWDVAASRSRGAETEDDVDSAPADGADAAEAASSGAKLSASVRPLVKGETYLVPVVSVDDAKGEAVLDLGSAEGVVSFASVAWARPFSPERSTPSPKKLSEVLRTGDIVRARATSLPANAKERVPMALAPVPLVQGALVSVDLTTRDVVALTGGYDFGRSVFNRATQAKRQPGSAFKPFVYVAALASRRFTAASRLNDAPEVVYDVGARKEWKPRNFEKDVFEGPMSLREGLAHSKNTIAVRLIEAIGPEAVIDTAVRAGITSSLPNSLTLALGSGEVTPLELANAYATVASQGRRAEPLLLLKVADSAGKVLEEHAAVFEETLSPQACQVTRSLMQSVVDHGTGVAARALGQPVGGKTGTAQEHRDAWFVGFTPDVLAATWVGFDDHSPLGPSETGARAALPTWLGYMQAAVEARPRRDFEPPGEGVEVVRIDSASGLLARDPALGREEWFIAGTAPTEVAPPHGQTDPTHVFFEDLGAKR